MKNTSASAFADTKTHYGLLDGLRGVAALLVVWYHVFEGYAFVGGGTITTLNHGYLAVDFFFMLSGFVLSFAYDDRWHKTLTLSSFFRRRLIRLHPMVVFGAVLGLITFCIQGSEKWDGTPVSWFWTGIALCLGALLIPAFPGAGYEVRGNGEMFPLNGPSWSLFFEYAGNIIYALFIRRLSTRTLGGFTIFSGILWVYCALSDIAGYGSMGVGWTLDWTNFLGGMIRMLFPFLFGMYLSRRFKPIPIRGAFGLCSVLLILLFAVPFVAGDRPFCMNGLYETFCLVIAFPAIVWMGASGSVRRDDSPICKFLGNISYPVYIVHYPFMYLFYSWMLKHGVHTWEDTWMYAVIVFAGSILVAYLALRWYDEPLRRSMARRFLQHRRNR